ncbi:MAG: HNH endonuclease [Isosphaeraceae bacterium]|nr:HNH endonuclease [Isosphaeraceae bacterium]
MLAEFLLGSVLAAAAGGVWYLVEHHRREHAVVVREKATEREQFRAALVRELRTTDLSAFSFSEFVERCEFSRFQADDVADQLFRSLCKQAAVDGVITEQEKSHLAKVQRALAIDPDRAVRIQTETNEARYRSAVESALEDGVLSNAESAELVSLRKRLSLDGNAPLGLPATLTCTAYINAVNQIIRTGPLTGEAIRSLDRLKTTLGITPVDALKMIQADATNLYRLCFTMAAQDGVITEAERRTLAWLQRESGLHDEQVAHHWDRLRRLQAIAEYRDGKLPSVATAKLLEGGEICHWHNPCRHRYETPSRAIAVEGELVITSKRLMFGSPSKNFAYSPSKIMDVRKLSGGLELHVNGPRGSGRYYMNDAEECEAILVGVVRKHKYLLSSSYTVTRTRHIPDDVKREVWDRDGGRCIRCGATEYLEFDHIIPHARGGANTVKNVQLLCRGCNGEKSDRI